MAIPSSIPPMISGSPFQRAKRNDPTLVPSTMAAKVESSSSPLARVSCASAQHFGKDAVLGGAEEIGLHRKQEEDHQQHVDAAEVKGDHADAHDHDFESLGELEDARFAEAIGQLACITGEQQERQNEDRARESQIP